MRFLNQLIVHVADLAEAEGRVARYHVVNLLTASIILTSAATLIVVGVVGLAAAAFVGLSRVMPAWVALGVVALGPLLAGVAGVAFGKGFLQR